MNTSLALSRTHQSVTVKDLITLKKAADNDDNPNAGIDHNNEAHQTQFLGMPLCKVNRVMGVRWLRYLRAGYVCGMPLV
jgi:hypothetical protein